MAPAAREALALAPPSRDIRRWAAGSGEEAEGEGKKRRLEQALGNQAISLDSSQDAPLNIAQLAEQMDEEDGIPAAQPDAVEQDGGSKDLEELAKELNEKAVAASLTATPQGSQAGLCPKDMKFLSQLDSALASGTVSSRGPLAQKMGRDPEAAATYKRLDSDEARRAFRLSWAQREAGKVEAKREHSLTWRRVDERKGTYRTLEAVALVLGWQVNPQKAIDMAAQHCRKCIAMGGKWVMKDTMTDQWLYLHMEVSHSDVMAEAWSMYETASTSTSSSSTTAADASTPAARASATAAIGSKGKGAKPKDEPKEVAKKVQATKVGSGQLMQRATKLRARALAILSRAGSMAERVAREDAWSWASGEDNIGMLSTALNEVQAKFKEGNIDDMLHVELGQLKKSTPNFEQKLITFMGTEDAILSLEKAYNMLWGMHKARHAR